MRPYPKKFLKQKRSEAVSQVAEFLLSNLETLSSSTSTFKKERGRGKEDEREKKEKKKTNYWENTKDIF